MGVQTGIDLPALVVATGMVRDVLGRPLGSHVSTAGPVDWGGSAPTSR
jgi:hydroxymethylglutaryl-CoA lyase